MRHMVAENADDRLWRWAKTHRNPAAAAVVVAWLMKHTELDEEVYHQHTREALVELVEEVANAQR